MTKLYDDDQAHLTPSRAVYCAECWADDEDGTFGGVAELVYRGDLDWDCKCENCGALVGPSSEGYYDGDGGPDYLPSTYGSSVGYVNRTVLGR